MEMTTDEKMQWICNEWDAAMLTNTVSGWKRVQTMMHGASMALLQHDMFDGYRDFAMLHLLAIYRTNDCLMEGRP